MRDFVYHRPSTLDEATRLGATEGAAFVAGGQGLVLDLRARRCSPASLVDLRRVVPVYIRAADEGAVVIGAGATHAEAAASPVVRERLPFLADLAEHVGDPAVRHRGTLGGALVVNDPAGDWPAACLALDAVIRTTARALPAADFFTGGGRTTLDPGEVVLDIAFPAAAWGAYLKFLNPASRYAMTGALVAMSKSKPRVAVTAASMDGAFRWREAEERLSTALDAARLAGLTLAGVRFVEDFFADGPYRAHLAGVLARRAVDIALGRSPPITAIVHGAPVARAASGDVAAA